MRRVIILLLHPTQQQVADELGVSREFIKKQESTQDGYSGDLTVAPPKTDSAGS